MDDETQETTAWALGDYLRLAHERLGSLGARLVTMAAVTDGARVLDVASGSGAAALAAASRGGDMVALDLTPGLLTAGR